MSVIVDRKPEKSYSKWGNILGAIFIINFLLACFVLLPVVEGRTIYFWLAKFYDGLLGPSLLLLPIGIITIVFGLFSKSKKLEVRAIGLVVSILIATLVSFPAFGWAVFISSLRVDGDVVQNHHTYYPSMTSLIGLRIITFVIPVVWVFPGRVNTSDGEVIMTVMIFKSLSINRSAWLPSSR